jgi:integrase
MKMALKHLGRRDLIDAIEYPRLPDRNEKVMAQVLKPDDVEKLIRAAQNLQDRLIIELLYETGARLGELYKLRIKDVQFENVSGKDTAILHLNGKSGMRRRRVYQSVPDLRAQVNNNPHHESPDGSLFLCVDGRPMTEDAFYQRVRLVGERAKMRIHPHQFRHTRATEDSRFYTDREMMMNFGWKSPTMVSVYSHLSMRDVEDKDLVLHGLKSREEILKLPMQVRICDKCQAENAPVAIYCQKCGTVLANQQSSQEVETLRAEIEKLKGQFETLAKAKYAANE